MPPAPTAPDPSTCTKRRIQTITSPLDRSPLDRGGGTDAWHPNLCDISSLSPSTKARTPMSWSTRFSEEVKSSGETRAKGEILGDHNRASHGNSQMLVMMDA